MPRSWLTHERFRKPVFIAGTFVVVLVIFFLLLFIPPIRRAGTWVAHGFVNIGNSLRGVMTRTVASPEALTTSLAICQDRVTELVKEISQDDALQKENHELKALLHYTSTHAVSTTTALIIGRAIAGQEAVLIDKGEAEGVVAGMAVVAENGLYYGRVSEVRPHTALVILAEHHDSAVPVALSGKGHTVGLVQGQDGVLLRMDFIPQETDIVAGDIVVTSGLDGQTPAGLIVGIVSSVVTTPSSPFKQAFIEPRRDPYTISAVLLVDL